MSNMRVSSWAQSAFTLVEMMVACAIMAILGGIVYVILNTGMVLFAKNTSVNLAHHEARMAMMQMEKELHLAVSPPQLVDANGSPVAGKGPAAGMSFHAFAGGPFKVAAKAKAGDTQVKMALGSYQPKAGQRLVIPTHEIEIDIAADCPGTGDRVVTLVSGIKNDISIQVDQGGTLVNADVIGFITDRISYIVDTGDLKYYARSGGSGVILARDITSDTPFSKPSNATGNPNSRSIAAINLSTGSNTNNGKAKGKKKYKAANMYLNAEVPARAQLCDNP